jgi:uncharacterized protein YjbI with pentapeptide repeats
MATDPAPAMHPDWETCTAEADCTGVRAAGFEQCLAHLAPEDLDTFIAGLGPGSDIDARGTTISEELLGRMTKAVRPKNLRNPTFGSAKFHGAHFNGGAWFDHTQFDGGARFDHTRFDGGAWFGNTEFNSEAQFRGTRFSGPTQFQRAQFNSNVEFNHAQFRRTAHFAGAQFGSACFDSRINFSHTQFDSGAWFHDAQFRRTADFAGAQFGNDTQFGRAQFRRTARFVEARFAVAVGLELVCADQVALDRAVFSAAAVVTVTAAALSCTEARFEEGVQLRGRYCEIALDGAVFASASRILGVSDPFPTEDDQDAEYRMALLGRVHERQQVSAGEGGDTASLPEHKPWMPVVGSLQRVDCTHLGLSNVDLTRCHFSGALNLDKLTLEGHCRFARPPQSRRWTRRQVLAEECVWRAWRGFRAWNAPPLEVPTRAPASSEVVSAELLTDVYRSLRRVREGSADQPGAADFYYGEMLFRLRAPTTPRAEKAILGAYWALSGFGLRAWRAMAALGILVVLTTVLLVGWGLPADSPVQTVDLTMPPATQGGQATAVVEQANLELPPWEERWSGSRLEQGARIALGSVVFRDAEQELTTAGSWAVIASRSLGPILLALAVLAIRARVKR